MSIFVSHSSKDKYLIDLFLEKILILGCGLNDRTIFCTSIEGLGIKNGEDFREHIKQKLKKSSFSFVMISNNYRQSEVCLNEMGASWTIDDLKVKQFLFPNLDFNSLGLLMNIKQAAKLEDSSSLDELYEELTSFYKIEQRIARWNKHKTDFLLALKSYSNEQSNRISPTPTEFFQSFLKEDISLNHLILKAHPTLLDCKQIFSEKYYKSMFESYCNVFEPIGNEYIEPLFPKRKFVRINKTNTMELMNGINSIAGGMVSAAQKGYFNYNVEFYSATFLEKKESKHGYSYKVFCFVNDRWVFIPKPWRHIDE